MHDALAGVVVGIGEQNVPVVGQGVGVDSEAVVLTGDEAAVGSVMEARLVVATVTIPEIITKKSYKETFFIKKNMTTKMCHL